MLMCLFHIFLYAIKSLQLDDMSSSRTPSPPWEGILLPDSLINSFTRRTAPSQANSVMISLMFQQHHEESLSKAWTRFKDLLSKFPHHGIDRWLQIQIFYDHVEYEITWQRTPKGWKDSRTPFLSNARRSMNCESISLTKEEEGGSNWTKVTPDNAEKPTETETETPVTEVEKINEVENGDETKSIKTSESKEAVEAPARKKKGKGYKVLPGGPAYDAILKKKITKKEDIRGNFKIPCSIGNLKHVIALVDQGSDVNVMPYSTYMKLADERSAETDFRLSLASHSYIYPLGIAEDGKMKNMPFILGTPFLTTAKASIKFDTGTITLRSGKHKVSFHRVPDSSNVTDKGVKHNIEPIAPTMTVNRLVLEWEKKIKAPPSEWEMPSCLTNRGTKISKACIPLLLQPRKK
ncbi:hypothetical protein Tco_0389666 [Tanacetum coccineum]